MKYTAYYFNGKDWDPPHGHGYDMYIQGQYFARVTAIREVNSLEELCDENEKYLVMIVPDKALYQVSTVGNYNVPSIN